MAGVVADWELNDDENQGKMQFLARFIVFDSEQEKNWFYKKNKRRSKREE